MGIPFSEYYFAYTHNVRMYCTEDDLMVAPPSLQWTNKFVSLVKHPRSRPTC